MKPFLVQAIPAQSPLDGLYDGIIPITQTGGGGNFSAVFQANHLTKKCPVALKFYAGQNDPYRHDAFIREGVLLNTILKGEPLFAQLVEPPAKFKLAISLPGGVSTWPIELPYLAFEWLPDGNLEPHCVPTQGYLDLLSRLSLFKEACRSVARLHFLGCAHRDLKPGNFFIFDRTLVKLGDFGTARFVAPRTPPLRTFYAAPPGDFRYIALETVAGVGADDLLILQRGDAHSLGAILFELLTGQKFYNHCFGSLQHLAQFMNYVRAIPEDRRAAAFHLYLDSAPNQIPNLRTINPQIPKCVAPHITTALERLSHVDYRRRLSNVSDIHRIIRICELVLRHEARARHILCADPTRRRPDFYV